jgi:hypothetical protein
VPVKVDDRPKAVRDSKGRFASGNQTGGRHKRELPNAVLKSKPLEELLDIGKRARAAGKLDVAARVYERLAEYVYGKPKQELDIDARTAVMQPLIVKFEGTLDEWSG